ncbi:RNA polymerase Rpb7, N-terminal domain containing protein [Tritrichomonas foetus]|uniref:RNA polymerase Rpb7, N-terminal domain containing protein n=1 Tax=Tritrichomonas foetus TaxID=1144522 RepID=A0A1J4JMA8_9EUKA|nr:RNA polymerase Rpb7, N-terminal domain containing protein [Tritrichomonas foetus]|eukprot:OHT00195.1 RNA polymerase Rpb7, N-terminal domain containing protein [Tritrichomonas foetus]
MFEVVVCREQVPVPYHHMKIGDNGRMIIEPQTLCDLITHRYNDRIQLKIGLFIDLYDIVKVTEVKSIPNVKVAYATCLFRYIVFNPPVGSIWEGFISGSTEEGIHIALTFFKDIWVPHPNLPDGSEFDDTSDVWTWTSKDDESGEDIPFTFEQGEPVRFRVCEVKFQENNENQLMLVIGSMDSRTAGLGLKSWWINPVEEEE